MDAVIPARLSPIADAIAKLGEAEQAAASNARSEQRFAELDARLARIEQLFERTYLQGPARPMLWTMLGGALLMVLLACSSVAGLQVFRAAISDHALAVHLALGAERRRLIVRAPCWKECSWPAPGSSAQL
jgi:hypothetical protein